MAYLMTKYKIKADEALEKVRMLYPKADPNFGFLIQLYSLEKFLWEIQIQD